MDGGKINENGQTRGGVERERERGGGGGGEKVERGGERLRKREKGVELWKYM